MKKFKEGKLKVVDYILESVFDIMEGDWGNYKEGDLVEYKVRLDWFDMWSRSSRVEIDEMMKEISNNELWENFEIEMFEGDVWNVKRSVENGKFEDGEVYKVSFKYKEIL
jgi:hypothetical protein